MRTLPRFLPLAASLAGSLLGAAAPDAAGQPATVGAQDPAFEVALVAWWLSPDVVLRADADDVAGSTIDFVREFDINRRVVPEFRAAFIPNPNHRIRLHFTPIDRRGVRRRPLDLVFQGQTFSGAQPATARLKWNIWRLSYEWRFLSRDRSSLGLLADIKFSDAEAAIADDGRTSSATQRAPLPALGLIARTQLTEGLSLAGEFSGFKIIEGFQAPFVGHLIEVDLHALYDLARHLRLQGGYRRFDISYTTSQKERRKAIVDEDTGAITFQGLYAGIVARF